jgi:hypothetical protein
MFFGIIAYVEIKLATALTDTPPIETPLPAHPGRDAEGMFIEGNKIALGAKREKDATLLAAEAEDLARRVLRDGGNITMLSLAKEIGWSSDRLRKFMTSPLYLGIQAKVNEEFYGSIDEHIKDERLDSITRVGAINARGYTLLGEIMDVVGNHAKSVVAGDIQPRATLIKAGVDAIAEARQAATMLHNRSRDESSHGTTNIFVTGKHASLIQTTMKEAGINLADVLDGYVDAEIVDETKPE